MSCKLSDFDHAMLQATGVKHECEIKTTVYDWREATAKDRAARAAKARAAEFARREADTTEATDRINDLLLRNNK